MAGFLRIGRSAYTRPPHGGPRGTRARLPARPPRRGARLRRDVRGLAGGRRVHRRLRRGRDRGALRRRAARKRRSCSACARPRARSARCCRSIRTRSSRSTCAATTASSRPRARGRTASSSTRGGPRLLLPQPVPLRLDRARGDAARAPSARPARAARAAQPLAPVGLDRRPAGRPLRRELASDRDRASGATSGATRRCSTRRWRPAASDPDAEVGGPLHGARRADGAQADRRGDPRVQRARPAARWSSATGRRCAGCGGSPGRRSGSPGG